MRVSVILYTGGGVFQHALGQGFVYPNMHLGWVCMCVYPSMHLGRVCVWTGLWAGVVHRYGCVWPEPHRPTGTPSTPSRQPLNRNGNSRNG